MFFMQIVFAVVLGLASIGSIAFVLINTHLRSSQRVPSTTDNERKLRHRSTGSFGS